MLTIAAGIVLAALVLAALPFVVLAVFDWRWWRCWLLRHRWERVEPFTYSTGMLSRLAHHRCRRCGAVPGLLARDLQ
jgi:hypothetical protein